MRSRSGSGRRSRSAKASEVEGEEGRRTRLRGAVHVGLAGEERPLLERLEARPPLGVEHHHLAVQDRSLEGQRAERLRHLRVEPRGVEPLAVAERRLRALLRREHPEAVVLDLEEPALPGERPVPGLGQHEADVGGLHPAAGRAEPLGLGGDLRLAAPPLPHLVERPPREDRLLGDGALSARVGEGVPVLDEEPLLRVAPRAHQRPHAPELVALELEEELPLLHPGVRILEEAERAAVPDDDRARAVVPRRDDALEVRRTRRGGPRRGPRAASRRDRRTAPSERPRRGGLPGAPAGSRSGAAAPRASGRRSSPRPSPTPPARHATAGEACAGPNGSGVLDARRFERYRSRGSVPCLTTVNIL